MVPKNFSVCGPILRFCEAFKNTHFLIECRTHIHSSSIMKTQRQTTAVGKANLHRLLLLYNTEEVITVFLNTKSLFSFTLCKLCMTFVLDMHCMRSYNPTP